MGFNLRFAIYDLRFGIVDGGLSVELAGELGLGGDFGR